MEVSVQASTGKSPFWDETKVFCSKQVGLIRIRGAKAVLKWGCP
jgi:hypothetical protein